MDLGLELINVLIVVVLDLLALQRRLEIGDLFLAMRHLKAWLSHGFVVYISVLALGLNLTSLGKGLIWRTRDSREFKLFTTVHHGFVAISLGEDAL